MANPIELTEPVLDEFASREREVLVQAAQAHDRWLRERDELRQRLDQAMHGLESKNTTILQLEVALAEERNRIQSFQAERDEAKDAQYRAEARLADVKAICDREELPPPKVRGKRKRIDDIAVGLTSNGEAVSNGGPGEGKVADSSPVLAHRTEVLDQSTP